MPGVTHVTAATQLPLTGSFDRSGITIEGRINDNPACRTGCRPFCRAPRLLRDHVDYPTAWPPVHRRATVQGAAPVAIVSQTMADAVVAGRGSDRQAHSHCRRRGQSDAHHRRALPATCGITGWHMPATMQVYMPHAQMCYPSRCCRWWCASRADRDPLAYAGSHARAGTRDRSRSKPVNNLPNVSRPSSPRSLAAAPLYPGAADHDSRSPALVLAVVGLLRRARVIW